MMRRRLSSALLVAATVIATAAMGHSWQEDTLPLAPSEVDEVLVGLSILGENAIDEEWLPPEGAKDSLIGAVMIYAATSNSFDLLPDLSQRVLITYEAISLGWLLPDGSIGEGADVFTLLQNIHLLDAPAVAERLEDFRAVAQKFSVGGG